LVDTRGIEQELHKKSIATEIEKHIDSVCAILITVNASTLGNTMESDYALSTLSAIFPKTLASNIAFMFTNVWSPSSWNFSTDAIPEGLKDSPHFLLNNPIALQKRYLKLKDDPRYKPMTTKMLKSVQAGEQMALETLVKLFDWLDGLEPQPAMEISSLYEKYQNIEAKVINILVQRDEEIDTRAEINRLMITLKKHSTVSLSPCLHLALESHARWMQDMDAFSDFDKTVDIPVLKQQPMTTRRVDDQVLVNEDMKKKWDEAKDWKETTAALIAINEIVLSDLNQAINCGTDHLVQLVGQCARLSLAKSCSVQIRNAVRFLEQKYIAMEKYGTAREKVEEVKESLDHMKRKLELLSKVEEDAQQGVSG
jgi:hypothetical protein